MTVPSKQQAAEVHIDEIRRLLEEAQTRPLTEAECDQLLSVAMSYCQVGEMLADRTATIAKLRKMLFGTSSEKTDAVLGTRKADSSTAVANAADVPAEAASKLAPKGHGRNGVDQYRSATHTRILHEAMKAGAKCPEAECKGILYKLAEPAVIVRIFGGPPLHAHVWDLERLRCNPCGKVFTAKGPDGLGTEKYDATAASMIGLLRYGTGVPFHRLAQLEKDLGVPLPVSTQWDIAAGAAEKIEPVFEALIEKAAQGEVVHNDDTTMQVLALEAELRARAADDDASDKRTGVFTTGIVAMVEEQRVALFFTGRQHAGENLADVLKHRAADRPPPMQMCDGLSRNLSKELEVILGNCLVHGRRQFVDVFDSFPEQCRHVLEAFREVYRHDATTKAQGMSPQERLSYHQANSGPVMDELQRWLDAQLVERKVEPNGRLGKAITYLQKRWEPLTLFLRRPGAPLDNNACYAERGITHIVVEGGDRDAVGVEERARAGEGHRLGHVAEAGHVVADEAGVRHAAGAEEERRELPVVGLADRGAVARAGWVGDRLVEEAHRLVGAHESATRIDDLGLQVVEGRQDREHRVVGVHAVHAEVVPGENLRAALGGESACRAQGAGSDEEDGKDAAGHGHRRDPESEGASSLGRKRADVTRRKLC